MEVLSARPRAAPCLRHKLANDGHDTRAIQVYLGHRNIQNTTRYTALAPQRFKEFFSRLKGVVNAKLFRNYNVTRRITDYLGITLLIIST
jgi:integrase